tara:strand:+ start:1243 stop:1863 length:621 start_codon:yes stop_codon:yes gene_type:complete
MVKFFVQPTVYHAKNAKMGFKNLSRDAKEVVVSGMSKIVKQELDNARTRLKSKGVRGSIYDKVSESMDFDIIDHPNDAQLPTFVVGSSSQRGAQDFMGVTGSRGANLSAILHFGKKKASSPLFKAIPVKPSAYQMLGGFSGATYKGKPVIWLMPGWASPAFAREPAFLDQTYTNIQRKFELQVPDMIRQAYGNKTMILKSKEGMIQ